MSSKKSLHLDGRSLTLHDLFRVARSSSTEVKLDQSAIAEMQKSRAWVDNAITNKKVIYGVTTGFGSFKNKFIESDKVDELQLNIIRSHASGVGESLREDQVRAAMLLRANSLAAGHSGIRVEVVEKLLELLNKKVYPFVPSQGSVGSSGDLAPLCHIMLILLGEGECIENNIRIPTSDIFKEKNISPISLSAKEGLALSNGTNVQTAVLALAAYEAHFLLEMTDLIAALSVEVLFGSDKPFEKNLNEVRRQKGQIETAEKIRSILKDSPTIGSHRDCDRVQDSYSLRCIPQVHGACRDTIAHVIKVVEREINAITDNPIIFPDEDYAVSGGNFHGEPIAQVADFLKIALAELSNISERRIAKMVDSNTSEGLPPFLIDGENAGLHSGLMIPQYTAAALVSESKVLAHPASVDSIPTSANQEDHVSMGTIAARQAAAILQNTKNVLAIELLNNTQAYEFRKPLKLSSKTGELYDEIRKFIPPIDKDRPFYLDIEKIAGFLDKKLENTSHGD